MPTYLTVESFDSLVMKMGLIHNRLSTSCGNLVSYTLEFLSPLSAMTPEGEVPTIFIASAKCLATVSALLLSLARRYRLYRVTQSISGWTTMGHLISLWFPPIYQVCQQYGLK